MATLIYRCNGQYFGYLDDGKLYSTSNRYLGWCENNLIYAANGSAIGELHQEKYVVRTGAILHNKIPRVPGISMNSPLTPGPALPIQLPAGWEDALESVDRLPSSDQVAGLWQHNQGVLEFGDDGQYFHQNDGDPSTDITGTWNLRSSVLSITVSQLSNPIRNFKVMEYTTNRMTLRLMSLEERSIPFTLQRVGPSGSFERVQSQDDTSCPSELSTEEPNKEPNKESNTEALDPEAKTNEAVNIEE